MATLSDWFTINEIEKGIWIIEEPGHVRSFLINGEAKSALIDTGMGFRNIRVAIEPLAHKDILVLNTHWHYDHIGGNKLFDKIVASPVEKHLLSLTWSNPLLLDIYVNPCREEGIPFPPGFIAEQYQIQGVEPTFEIDDGDQIDLGERVLKVIATPGHTRGSLSFLDTRTRTLFTGDLVYREQPIYAHFEDSSLAEYISSIKKLLGNDSEFYRIYPSHCSYPMDRKFLAEVLESILSVGEGELKPEIIEDWDEPVYMYSVNEIKILSKMPGARGVKLFVPPSTGI